MKKRPKMSGNLQKKRIWAKLFSKNKMIIWSSEKHVLIKAENGIIWDKTTTTTKEEEEDILE